MPSQPAAVCYNVDYGHGVQGRCIIPGVGNKASPVYALCWHDYPRYHELKPHLLADELEPEIKSRLIPMCAEQRNYMGRERHAREKVFLTELINIAWHGNYEAAKAIFQYAAGKLEKEHHGQIQIDWDVDSVSRGARTNPQQAEFVKSLEQEPLKGHMNKHGVRVIKPFISIDGMMHQALRCVKPDGLK